MRITGRHPITARRRSAAFPGGGCRRRPRHPRRTCRRRGSHPHRGGLRRVPVRLAPLPRSRLDAWAHDAIGRRTRSRVGLTPGGSRPRMTRPVAPSATIMAQRARTIPWPGSCSCCPGIPPPCRIRLRSRRPTQDANARVWTARPVAAFTRSRYAGGRSTCPISPPGIGAPAGSQPGRLTLPTSRIPSTTAGRRPHPDIASLSAPRSLFPSRWTTPT